MALPWRTLLVCLPIALAGCRPAPAENNQVSAVPDNQAEKLPVALPQPEAPLDREALLMAVIRARSAAAAGADGKAAQAELDGKRFEFRIALGCNLAPPDAEGAAAIYDPEKQRVELSVTPDAALIDPAVAAAAAEAVEAAEGFWIADPWLFAAHCAGASPPPPAPAEEETNAPAGQRRNKGEPVPAPRPIRPGGVALVQFFTEAEPRSARRGGRPYTARQTIEEGAGPPAPGSWELVLSGRLQALEGGRVIACRPTGPGSPPACIVSVRFDRVAIVNRQSGEQLAEWSSG